MARLLDVLSLRHPGASKRTLRQMLARRRVTVDGRTVTRPDTDVPDGARVTLRRKAVRPARAPVTVVYDDQHLLVLDKPAGLLSAAPRASGKTSAWAAVRDHLVGADKEPLLVHRLDEAASGLLVFAKSAAVQASLRAIFTRRDLERLYLAVVDGHPPADHGVVTTRLLESDRRPYKVRSLRAADPPALERKAEHARTHWRVIGRAGDRAALLVRLETGRKHQIRVHLSELGCPVVGDRVYGGSPFARLLLHAAFLRFRHPVTGAVVLAASRPGRAFRQACPDLPEPLPSGFDPPGPRGEVRGRDPHT